MQNNTARKLTQIPPEALIVGIDPHKKMHAVVIMTHQAQVRLKCKIKNERPSFDTLVQTIQQEVVKSSASSAMVAIEAGGHYWRNLAYYLQEQQIAFRLINPFTLKRRREGDDLARRKTDYRDATAAAELLRTGQFTETRLPDKAYAELRPLHQARRRMIKEYTRGRNLLRGLLDGLFPEFCAVFKDPLGQTALAVLSACPVPSEIAALPVAEFLRTVRSAGDGQRLAVKKVRALHAVAATSVGVKTGAQGVRLELQLLVSRLCLLRGQIAQVEKHLVTLVQQFDEYLYLRSIPGMGVLTMAGLIAEIGPVGHYGNAKDLVKLAGVNPNHSESAGKGSSHTPMSKKGRAGLRACLWQAALGLLRSNLEFQTWAKHLAERGPQANPLHKREVLGAAMNKLLRLYFALVRKKQVYHPRVASGELVAA